jgi:hypothetical protein
MNPETIEVLKWVGGALVALVTGAIGGGKMAQRQIANTPAMDPTLLASFDIRLNNVAKDVVDRSHDFKGKLQAYELDLHRLDKEITKLEGRSDRSESDIREVKSTFISEFRRLEDTLAERFNNLERKVDRITPRSGGVRRSSDPDEED